MMYFKEKKKELIEKAFEDFKKKQQLENILQFSYDDFIVFINTNNYGLIAYKWHMDEYALESESGKLAVSVFNFLMAKIRKKKGETSDIRKIDKNLFEISV